MNTVAFLQPETRAAIEDEIRHIDGIIHASFDRDSGDLWVIRDPAAQHEPIEVAVRSRIAGLGHDPATIDVRITLPTPPGPRRRVRFVDATRSQNNERVTVEVRLEWQDEVHTGSAEGEKGDTIELRTAAQAAVDAVQKVTGTDLSIRLIGVKVLHAFDSDLMVASLLLRQGGIRRLVGAVLVGDNLLSAASLAVLSALNRTLGNFLHTPD